MRKFRFKGDQYSLWQDRDTSYGGYVIGEIYDYGSLAPEDPDGEYTTSYYVEAYPKDWEEVFDVEENQKSPEQYYAGGNQINTVSISGVYNGVVFSLAGDFEQCAKMFNFISYLEIPKK